MCFVSLQQILPQYMNEAGYESHMVGKWHLGSYKRLSLPNHRGFKSYLGYLHGTDTYYSHEVDTMRLPSFGICCSVAASFRNSAAVRVAV